MLHSTAERPVFVKIFTDHSCQHHSTSDTPCSVSYFPPGSTIGIVGAGQLGRMSAIAAHQLGYRVHVLDHSPDQPASGVADREFVADFSDLPACVEFAKSCDVVTFEFENVPFQTLRAIESILPVRPSPSVLFTTRHRIREKDFLSSLNVPVARYASCKTVSQLQQLLPTFQTAIAKTCELGYDGKGQFRISHEKPLPADLLAMLEANTEFVLEAIVPFDLELSVIVARTPSGETRVYEPFENEHRHHILDLTHWPARVSASVANQAKDISLRIASGLHLVGLLCVELFVTPDGQVIANELAPRPHNSGHITQNACKTSQFEQHIRAVVGLPLGSNDILQPGAMANLLGDLWNDGPPDFAKALALDPELKLHLYGKRDARKGRKMGHLNLTGPDAAARVIRLRAAL
jgi:5-(carboxyamino)imidazole ribonucleotide synthase